MNSKTILFLETESVSDRQEKIRDEFKVLRPIEIIEATLHKKGYPDMEYGYGDADLKFADSITITYEIVKVQKCKTCGCHQDMACTHEKLGECWWVKDDLCSHCYLESEGKITNVQRPWMKGTAELTKC